MRDRPLPGRVLGYGTNVHAAITLDELHAALDRHATAVRAAVCPDSPMGLGLWLGERVAAALPDERAVTALRRWLEDRGLFVFTLNAFPQGDFHADEVKHAVYQPDWRDPARAAYTRRVAEILAGLLDEGDEGSLSTLPLGWGAWSSEDEGVAADAIMGVVEHLAAIEERTGRLLHLDLEPEPGCALQRSTDIARFAGDHLLGSRVDDLVRRHLRVCHDACHAAVMHDPLDETLAGYDAIGLAIGKVQVSSALRVDWDVLDDPGKADTLAALAGFAEDRYLHQSTVRDADGALCFHEDLPGALSTDPGGEWRVHFHVPVFAASMGVLGTTRDLLAEDLRILLAREEIHHYEVETYAWDVLPEAHRPHVLAEGIARELQWVRAQAEVTA